MARIINVEIDANGDFSIDLTGFKGKGCSALTQAFAKLGTETKAIKKPEYREQTKNSQNQ